MSKSFYSYIIDDLLLGWFKNNVPAKGSRYYIVIENDEHRNGIINALKEHSDPITISNIFEGAELQEESYHTSALKIEASSPKLIIGDDTTASEDYLTTLRNSVGVENSPYENYGVLYILSRSLLSSLITASQDLEGVGFPLHATQIAKRIEKDVDEKIPKDLEKIYIKKHLENISELISDGMASLFDFEPTMTILGNQTIRGNYGRLEMFEDKIIYSNSYNPDDKDMAARVDKNKEIYRRVNAIMCDDEDDKCKELVKFLDEKLARKLSKTKGDEWKSVDFCEFEESQTRKASTGSLVLEDVSLTGANDDSLALIWNQVGKPTKSTKNYIVVCDRTGNDEQEVVLRFNKTIKQAPKTFKVSGQSIKVCVKDKVTTFKIGLDDNHHDFFILRLPYTRYFFKDIKHCFSLNKNGEIVVKVPEDLTDLSFENGDTATSLPVTAIWDWDINEKLMIPAESDDEQDTFAFAVRYDEREQKVILKLNQAKPVLPLEPGSFPQETLYKGIDRDGVPFKKVSSEEIERGIKSDWRKYLVWERLFIDEQCLSIKSEINDLTQETENFALPLDVDPTITDALSKIYAYFSEKETIPSLCPIDDDLRNLYSSYCNAVVKTVNKIPSGKSLSKSNHNLTRLGTVWDGERFYMSPFHPLMVAYTLEYDLQSDGKDKNVPFARELMNPFYLVPFLTYNDNAMRPYCDSFLKHVRNWLVFENADNKPQERANDITTRMVMEKMDAFIKNFSYLFQDKECPIVISAIGLADDINLIKGIIDFIKMQFEKGVQKIELHEYVEDLMCETFFEKLNRLDSIDSITRELKSRGSNIESRGIYTNQDIIHQLFTRVAFYKHNVKKSNEIKYCHIAFYQMNTGSQYVTPPTNETRTELAFNGLISIPSTLKKEDGAYYIGFGTKGVNNTEGYIHPMAMAYNNLYGNEKNGGSNMYSVPTAVTKKFEFFQSHLLDSIYENANWVTFLNPEVDINFFYQPGLYVVHYTDQYGINAKYDSITVTKHVGLYENLLKKSYEQYALSPDLFASFNKTMKDYFNCLNGSWMLRLVNQTEVKVREKMSLVATSIVMQKFLKRNPNIIWIPISLDEILRVTGDIHLNMDAIFSKKTLGVKGAMSDDLLMMGLDATNKEDIKVHFYPIEVKASDNSSMASKGSKQVSHTWMQFKEHLFGNPDFRNKIYRTFFISQFLINADKLHANNLIEKGVYEEIESVRYELLNLKWKISGLLPEKEMGVAAVVSFFASAAHSLSTKLIDGVPICEIHFSEEECFKFVADSSIEDLDFLSTDTIHSESEAANVLNSEGTLFFELPEPEVEFTEVEDSDNDEGYVDVTPNIESENSDVKEPALGTLTQPIKIIVGHGMSNKQEIVFEPNNTKMVSHPNMGIIGTMGTGKTQFARSVIAQFSKENDHNVGGKPTGMLVFDYKGDYKDKEFLDVVGGTCYKFNYPFNPLKLVINDEVEGMNLPAITADRIADSFAKAYGLGLKQQSNIKQVIIETYAEAGITRDTSTWEKPVPTMEDVIKKYFEKYDANDKAYALFDKLRDYTIFTPDTSKCVSLFEWLNSVRVIDLTLYPDDTKKVIVSLILDLFYAEMRQLGGSSQRDGYRELRAMILVDEAHQFLKKDFNSFRSVISEGRMFGVGMILSTQNISDFKTSKEDYSQFILSWVIHHVNSISKSEIASIFGQSDSNADRYIDFINKAKLFESICKIGQKTYGVRDLPFFELIKNDERFAPSYS